LGPQDSRLRQLERELRVEIFVRHDPLGEGAEITARGPVSRVDKALLRLKNSLSQGGGKLAPKKHPALCEGILLRAERGRAVRPRGERQKEYLEAIFDHDMVVSVGPAGTGKTFLAVAAALRALELGLVERIILTRPVVEAGEKLGFLPGDLYEKVHPYLRPLYDAFRSLLGPDKFRALKDDEILEIVPLAYMRGRTLEDAFIILDEAQNTGSEQMKMFLTRMGMNSKVVVTGDVTQIDLKEKSQSGLVQIMQALRKIPAIKFVQFTRDDVQRHPLVKEIVQAYEGWEARRP